MVKGKLEIVWDEEARVDFKKAIAYIKKDSPQNADKIRKTILASTKRLADEPLIQHRPDKDRVNNDGSYRAYEIFRFRISYFVGKGAIRIVRFRHTSQEPQKY